MTFKELRQRSGMNLTQFSKYFNIPYRTIQNWERGERQCPEYLLHLMEYKLKNEGFFREKDYVKIPAKAIENERNPEKAKARLKKLLSIQEKLIKQSADAEANAMTLEMKKHFDESK